MTEQNEKQQGAEYLPADNPEVAATLRLCHEVQDVLKGHDLGHVMNAFALIIADVLAKQPPEHQKTVLDDFVEVTTLNMRMFEGKAQA